MIRLNPQIFKDPKIPLAVGAILIGAMGWLLMLSTPMPNGLAWQHQRVDELGGQESCQRCHNAAGLTAGCLGCHTEIDQQLQDHKGYHAFLLKDGGKSCRDCHQEHSGHEFTLVNSESWGAQVPRAFKHPHVEYVLEGKHRQLSCEKCHEEQLKHPFKLPGFVSTPRPNTFLGLDQDCRTCHKDRHSDGLTPSCGACHGQEVFNPPAHFDHAQHFPLIGGHVGVECRNCHRIPVAETRPKPFPFPFDEARGKRCEECHKKPHHSQAIERCEECHQPAVPKWNEAVANLSVETHTLTGFRLLGAHSGVQCEKCHPRDVTFQERYPDPLSPDYQRGEDTCQGCHRDVHKGQFQARYDRCLDCHDREHFIPSTFGHEVHSKLYPLVNAHLAVACTGCHRMEESTHMRKFSGTSHVCKDCHEYPHGKQFRKEIDSGDCTSCHSGTIDTFRIRPFDHDRRTAYPLAGAHVQAACNDCHVESPDADGKKVRQYRGNSQECSSCHRDVHRGQFQSNGQTVCGSCHQSFQTWKYIVFNHNTMSRFPLEGAHTRAACNRCHKPVKLSGGGEIIQYKPLGVQCGDCHEIVPVSNSATVR